MASEVPDQDVVAEFASVTSFSVRSPVADQPTATISGSILPCELGPLSVHDAISPHECVLPEPREEAAPTDTIPGEPPGLATVPYPCPPFPRATMYVVLVEYTRVSQSR